MSHEVRAVVLTEQGTTMQVEKIHVQDPDAGQVRVRLVAAGVCHSDLSLANGTLYQPVPAVLGHEGAGLIESIGAGVEGLAVGDPVLLNWAPACGECWFCQNGEPHLCEHASDLISTTYATREDGTPLHPGLGAATFGEETVVPATSVVQLPSGTDLAAAAVIGCAMMTGVGAVTHTAQVSSGQSVAVIGLGGVGLSVLQGARMAGAGPIIAIDTSESKEELARSMGATDFVLGGPDTAKQVRKLTDGRGVDHAFEVVGKAATIRQAWSVSRRGGTVTVVGVGSKNDKIEFTALELFYFGRTLKGSVFGGSDPRHDAALLLDSAAAGQLDPLALITDEITLDDVPAAFQRMQQGIGGRSLIRF